MLAQIDPVAAAGQLAELGAWGLLIALATLTLRWLLARLKDAEQRERDAQAELRAVERERLADQAEYARALLEIATRSQDQRAALQWGRGGDSSERR